MPKLRGGHSGLPRCQNEDSTMTRYRDKESGEVVEVVMHGMLRTTYKNERDACRTMDCEEFDAR